MNAHLRSLIFALLTSLVAVAADGQEKGTAPSGAPPLPEPTLDPAARAAAAAVQAPLPVAIPPLPTAAPAPATPATLWRGSGLCCEPQGDGVPCQGTDGECEHCGRALPPES